jgi:hypothetical protein
MSQLTVWLRAHGLGGALNAFEGVEGTVVSAVQANPQIQTLETTAVADVGTAAQNVIVGVFNKVTPGAGQVAKEVSDPFLVALEAFATHYLQGSTVTAEIKPAAPAA